MEHVTYKDTIPFIPPLTMEKSLKYMMEIQLRLHLRCHLKILLIIDFRFA